MKILWHSNPPEHKPQAYGVSSRYDLESRIQPGEKLLWCSDCGAAVPNRGVGAHDRFHARIDPGRHYAPEITTGDSQ